MTVQPETLPSRFQFGLLWSRMRKAATLDREMILELKENKTATGQSLAVLVFAALAIGIGSTLKIDLAGNLSVYGIIVGGLRGIITGCFSAFIWSGTLYLVGTKLFQGKTTFWELARPMFFASSPALLFILIAIPISLLTTSVALVAAAWVVLLQGFVLKHVMGFNTQRTVLTLAVGFMILLFIYLSIY